MIKVIIKVEPTISTVGQSHGETRHVVFIFWATKYENNTGSSPTGHDGISTSSNIPPLSAWILHQVKILLSQTAILWIKIELSTARHFGRLLTNMVAFSIQQPFSSEAHQILHQVLLDSRTVQKFARPKQNISTTHMGKNWQNPKELIAFVCCHNNIKISHQNKMHMSHQNKSTPAITRSFNSTRQQNYPSFHILLPQCINISLVLTIVCSLKESLAICSLAMDSKVFFQWTDYNKILPELWTDFSYFPAPSTLEHYNNWKWMSWNQRTMAPKLRDKGKYRSGKLGAIIIPRHNSCIKGLCRNVQFPHACLDVAYRSWDKSSCNILTGMLIWEDTTV